MFKDGSKCKITGIGDETKGAVTIREKEDRGHSKAVDQGIKGGLLGCIPKEWDVFLSKVE